MTSILLVDDDASLRETLALDLVHRGYVIETCGAANDAIAAMQRADFDVVVTDLAMDEVNGIELCTRITATRRDVPVIVLTAFGNFDSAVAAIRAGAYDFLSKPVPLDALAMAIERAAKHRRLRGELRRLERDESSAGATAGRGNAGEVGSAGPFDHIVATSAAMESVAGNKSAAARILRIDRKRLGRMLDRLGLGRSVREADERKRGSSFS